MSSRPPWSTKQIAGQPQVHIQTYLKLKPSVLCKVHSWVNTPEADVGVYAESEDRARPARRKLLVDVWGGVGRGAVLAAMVVFWFFFFCLFV